MFAPHRVMAVVVVLAALGRPASAERIAITNVHAEPDVADEAGAVTLLIRTALVGSDRTLLEAPTGLTVAGAGAVIAKVGADHAVLLELAREGFSLRITLAIVGTEGAPDVSLVRSGDGDLQTLAKGVVDHITTTLHLEPGKISDTPLGRLRPYVVAMRLRTSDPAAAARALAFATPSTVFAVPAATAALRGLSTAVTDPALAMLAARAMGDANALDAISAAAKPEAATTAMAARVFAAIARTNLHAADAELATNKLAKDAMLTLVGATVAELHGDDKRMNGLLLDGAGSQQQAAILALGSTIVPARLTAASLRALLGDAEHHLLDGQGVVSRIGLTAAEANVDVPRALALISVRELDDYEIKRLEALIPKATDPTAARLRAEIALRRADGTEATAIGDYVHAAPDEPRAHRYLGWLLMSKDLPKDAATEFAKAGSRREQSRALLAANDIPGALAAIEGVPTSAEELVVKSRDALLAGRLDDAAATIELAERVAPVSPTVQAAVIDLAVKRRDSARAALAKLLVERGAGKTVTTKIELGTGDGIAVKTQAVGSAEPKPEVTSTVDVDPALLAPMLAVLPGLAQLPHHKLALVELAWAPSLMTFRTTHPDLVRAALAQLLTDEPYKLQVAADPHSIVGSAIDAATLGELTGDSDAVLVYRVEPDSAQPNISLLLYMRGATEAKQVSRTLPLKGVVGWDVAKLALIAVLIAALLGALVLWLTRATAELKILVEKASDVSDEVLCVEITKRASRPAVSDLQTFAAAIKKAGSVTKPRLATLIASGAVFRVPTGTWYVHLYGTFTRGGELRRVADTCTQKIELKRGDSIDLQFDLTSKLAEVTVRIESDRRAGVTVWANDDQSSKVVTDAEGDADLLLPVGNHTIHIDAHGTPLAKPLQIVAPRMQVLTINIKREMRFMNDVAINTDAHHDDGDLELAPSLPSKTPSQQIKPLKLSFDGPPSSTAPIPVAAYGATASAAESNARPPRAMTPVPGDMLLGRYRVKAELGRGAMGIVHHAWDEKLEREVAIKEMADDLRQIPEAMQLFVQEAKALAQLNHTNIVAMYDQVTETDKVYMIMEYVDGNPLEAIVRERGALPWIEAVGIMDQACAGLAYAHARKVIHRDIKPANIFVARDKVVKLGDFGLARVMREVTIRKTEIRGTPLYMAPEQIRGTDVDHRTDLYAVGCTLFELCTGRPPFIEGDILFAQMSAQPPVPSSLVPALPKPLDTLIQSLLEKQADDRPGSANEVRTAFRELTSF